MSQIASYFDRERGLAMGLALAGVGLGTALMPSLSNLLIGAVGWRIGYVGLGAAIVVPALLPVAFLLPEPQKRAPSGETPDRVSMIGSQADDRQFGLHSLGVKRLTANTIDQRRDNPPPRDIWPGRSAGPLYRSRRQCDHPSANPR